MERKQKVNSTIWISIAIAVICSVIAFLMIKERLVFAVDSIKFNNKDSLTVGMDSDISFHKVPHNYITIKCTGKSYSWNIDKKQDKLFYYKINGDNPNRYKLYDTSQIKINDLSLNLNGIKIKECIGKYNKQHYFLLRNVISKLFSEQLPDLKDNEDIKSLIYKDKGEYSIIILDNKTTISDKGYVYEGSVLDKECKIQFFTVRSYSTKTEKIDKDYFFIGDVNYYAKPEVLLTEWQSGHILLRTDGKGGVMMHMPKCVMFTCTLDSLRKESKKTAGLLTLKQRDLAFPIDGSIYMPSVSSYINMDICNLRFSNDNDNVEILMGNNKKTIVKSNSSFVPNFEKETVKLRNYELNCRIGLINGKFILSYFLGPGLIFVIAIFFFFRIKMKYKIPNDYFRFIFPIYSISFCYCICKTMIAIKLSYTFPFFEKMTSIIPVYTSLFMVLVFLLIVMLNNFFLEKCKRWTIFLIGLGLITICGIVQYFMDCGINNGMISAYRSGEISFLSFLKQFNDSDSGINDIHRSIIYTLFSANIALLLIIPFVHIIRNALENVDNIIQKSAGKWTWGGYAFIMCVGLVLPCIYNPNWITAVITTILLWGYPKFVAKFYSSDKSFWIQKVGKNKYITKNLCIPAIIFAASIVIIFLLAVFPDKGYITNSIGIALTIISFGIIVSTSKTPGVPTKEEQIIQKKFVRIYCVSVFIAIVGIVIISFLLSKDAENINYERMVRRFTMAYNFSDYEQAGYRYNDSDAEFVKIMNYYANNPIGVLKDPLSSDDHILHQSVSSGQSPVILNDMSMPCAFIGAYGACATIIFFILLFGIYACIRWQTLDDNTVEERNQPIFDDWMQRRLFAAYLWIGTSIYLYLSYKGYWIPFTGRLNPGLGVDSVGEALESAILLAVMTIVEFKKNKK